MANAGQAIVFRANAAVQRTGSEAGAEGRWKIANPLFHRETGVGQRLAEPAGRPLPSSGWAWMRWLSYIRPSRADWKRSRAADFASISTYFAGMTAGGTRTPVPYFSIVRVFMLYTSPGERT